MTTSVEVTPVSRGAFALDEQRALEKLRNFQLPHPYDYILEFVKVAHLLGAETMEVWTEPQKVVISIDGEPPAGEHLEQLYARAFAAGDDPAEEAIRHLAMGINAALGAGFEKALIDAGGEASAAYEVRDDEVVALGAHCEVDSGIRVRMLRRFHRSLLARFRRVLPGGDGEVERLAAKTRSSRVSIIVDGDVVGGNFELSGNPPGTMHYSVEKEEGLVLADLSTSHLTTRLLQHGVFLHGGSRKLSLAPLGGRAMVDSGRLKTDLSQQKVVADRQLELLRRRVDGVYCESLAEVLDRADPGEILQMRRKIARAMLRFFGTSKHYAGIEQSADRLADTIAELPLFRPAVRSDEDDPRLTIEEAMFEREGQTTIEYATKWFGELSSTDLDNPVIWANPDLSGTMPASAAFPRALGSFADRVVDGTERLEQKLRWHDPDEWDEPDEDWRHNRPRLFDDPGELIRRRVSTDSEGTYEIVVNDGSDPSRGPVGSHLFYVRGERLLDRRSFWSPFGPFLIGVFGEFVPDRQFDGFRNSPGLNRAHIELLRILVERIETGAWCLHRFRMLFGALQDLINRTFRWEWSDWPEEFDDTPLGLAPELAERGDGSEPGCGIQHRLDKLGELAGKPVVSALGGDVYSLRVLGELMSHDSPYRKVHLVESGDPAVEHRAEGENVLHLQVPRRAIDLLQGFLSCDVCGSSHVPVIGDRSTADEQSESEGLRVEIDTSRVDLRDRAVTELRSRIGAGGREVSAAREPPSSNDTESEEREPDTVPDPFDAMCAALKTDLTRCSPEEETSRFSRIDWVETTESNGDAVVILRNGYRVALNRIHPVVAGALRSTSDRVAQGIAAVAVYNRVSRFDVEHGRNDRTPEERLEHRRQTLKSMSRAMTSGAAGSRGERR